MLRYVAPAGAPIGLADLARWARLAASSADVETMLRRDICSRFGVRHCFLTNTGRAGQTLLLRAMRRLAPSARDEVVVPSYTCYSVAASVVKAGLRPRIVDISPDTLGYEPHEIARTDFSRVLAIIATNLYGLPNDLPALSRLARDHHVFLIDDAAQAMGATVGGRASGTWGDAGLFSFDKGKNVSAIDGGVIVTNSDTMAEALDKEIADLPGATASPVDVAKVVAYSLFLRPSLYGIPQRIPQLGLGRTVFTTDFAVARPSRVLAALGVTMVRRLGSFTAARRANAEALSRELRGMGVNPVAPLPGSEPVYLRLPVLAASEWEQRAAIDVLTAAGIGATRSYPASLADLPELRGVLANGRLVATGGRDVASRVVTLPTHPFVTAADIRRTVRTLSSSVCGGSGTGGHVVRTKAAP
jgi:dTDP-4-amino-4,6-dideoxygalactose transaminase